MSKKDKIIKLQYHYDEFTKEFTYSDEAYYDPLESGKNGELVYLLAANSTFKVPLESKLGYAVIWNESNWEYIEDFRGSIVWKSHDESLEIKELGPIPDGYYLDRPSKKYTSDELKEFIYNQKCNIAYNGVTVVKNNNSYLFETSMDSIVMANAKKTDIINESDDYIIYWKVWSDNEPKFISFTKLEFDKIFSFGMNMINQSFLVENELNEYRLSITEDKLSDSEFINEFMNYCIEKFNEVNTIYEL